jgi:hypothetical protein
VDRIQPVFLSATGVIVAAVAFYNRDKPTWQRDMSKLYVLAITQVMLGGLFLLLLR